MTDRDAYPEELSSLRAMSGLSVEALAARAGLPAQHLAELEAGTRQCSSKTYDQVFDAVEEAISEVRGAAVHEGRLVTVEARMSPDELRSWRAMSGYTSTEMARRLGVRRKSLRRMEAGEEMIPRRFDDDVETIVDEALFAMDDPVAGEAPLLD